MIDHMQFVAWQEAAQKRLQEKQEAREASRVPFLRRHASYYVGLAMFLPLTAASVAQGPFDLTTSLLVAAMVGGLFWLGFLGRMVITGIPRFGTGKGNLGEFTWGLVSGIIFTIPVAMIVSALIWERFRL